VRARRSSAEAFQDFFRTEAAGGAALIACAAVALAIANSEWAGAYDHI